MSRFCDPQFDRLRQEREPFTSENLRQLLRQVAAMRPQEERAVRRARDARLSTENSRSQVAVRQLLTRLAQLRQGNEDAEARLHWQRLRQAVLQHDFRDAVLQRYGCVTESSYYQNGTLYLTSDHEIIPPHLAQATTIHWRMNTVYSVIKENQVIREYFEGRNYRLAFPPQGQRFFTPYCYQAILAGAIGEEAITALLHAEGIELEELPDILFEVADIKMRGFPWYFDCKNYNERTLEHFSLPEGDPARHMKLNETHFRESAQTKLARLQRHHGTPVKLIYLNLVTTHPRPRGYYDENFEPVSFEEASIIVIQGVLQRHAPNAYHQAFAHFLRDVQRTTMPQDPSETL